MLAAHFEGASHANMVTRVTDLLANLAKGTGSLKYPIMFERDMASHTLEKMIKAIRSQVTLIAGIKFKLNSYVVSVNDDPAAKASKELSMALARALAASCLGEDLKAMVETHNATEEEPVTFDGMVRWMKGEVGGKYPLSSFREGLKQMFVGKAWTKEVLHLRFAELKQLEVTVSNTIALYIEAHREYLMTMFRLFYPEVEGQPDMDEGAAVLESKQKVEKEKRIEERFSVWKEAEYAKLEGWVHPNNFEALLAKARAEASAEEEEAKAAEKQGQGGGQVLTAQELFSAKTSALLDRANKIRRDLEEKGKAKMRELREEFEEPKGAGAAPSQSKGLRVSVEKLRFQKEDVAECLIADKMIEWIVMEGDKRSMGDRMEPKRPFRLTWLGRSNVYRLCLPTWLRKKLLCLNDKRGVTLNMFEFVCRRQVARVEDEKEKPKGKNSKSQSSSKASKGSTVELTPPLTGSSSKKEKSVGSASSERKVDQFLEHARHTVAKEKLQEYYHVGRGGDPREEKREKLQWLAGDAKALGYTSWAEPYARRLKALDAGTQGAGRGGFSGRRSGRGGNTMGRGGGKGSSGRGGGKGGGSQGQGDFSQNRRRSSRPQPAPGYFKGMQALTLTHPPTHPPSHPQTYNPYQHLQPYYPYFNPYAQPVPTQHNQNDTTNVTNDDSRETTEVTKTEETGVGGWDEQGQVATDAEDEPQHNTWADAESYEDYYGGQGEDPTGEDYY